MAAAKKGDKVKVHYTGKLTDGTVFDDSLTREPLEFTIGDSDLIPGFDNALLGMNVNEWKTVTIAACDAYGLHRPEMVGIIDRKELPPDLVPVVGQQLQVSQDDDRIFVVTVTAFTDDTVTLDANHPLAGKDLVFEINLVEIVSQTP